VTLARSHANACGTGRPLSQLIFYAIHSSGCSAVGLIRGLGGICSIFGPPPDKPVWPIREADSFSCFPEVQVFDDRVGRHAAADWDVTVNNFSKMQLQVMCRFKLTRDKSVKRDLKEWNISKYLAMDRSAWRLAINVPELWPLSVLCLLCPLTCLSISRLFWVSSLAYPNLLGTKDYVVVVGLVVAIASDVILYKTRRKKDAWLL
jgi:hypothetical protein